MNLELLQRIRDYGEARHRCGRLEAEIEQGIRMLTLLRDPGASPLPSLEEYRQQVDDRGSDPAPVTRPPAPKKRPGAGSHGANILEALEQLGGASAAQPIRDRMQQNNLSISNASFATAVCRLRETGHVTSPKFGYYKLTYPVNGQGSSEGASTGLSDV